MCNDEDSHCTEIIAVGAQSTSTASIVEIIFDSADLSGQVGGVGPDGTTYVLSATYTVDSEDETTIAFPYTSKQCPMIVSFGSR